MKTLIIGCRMMENELRHAYLVTKRTESVRWIEAGLHNVKGHLRSAIQQILNEETSYDRILLAASFCGNSYVGLETCGAELIIPRADDCISVLFGGVDKKLQWMDSYFLTEGWIKSGQSLMGEYRHSLDKYGEKRSFRIFQAMLAGYRRFLLLDTGSYDLAPSMETAQKMAETFSKEFHVLKTNTGYLEELLNGPWPEKRFLTVPPYSVIKAEDLYLPGEGTINS